MVQAERAFREAIRLDPGYARAHSALALALLGETWLGGRRGIDVFPLAKEATQRARTIDESMALAHSALGEIYAVFESNPLAAQREHVRAIHLDDNDPWVIRSYGFFLLAINAFDDALELNRRDLELEPTSPLANRVRAQMLTSPGDMTNALRRVGRRFHSIRGIRQRTAFSLVASSNRGSTPKPLRHTSSSARSHEM